MPKNDGSNEHIKHMYKYQSSGVAICCFVFMCGLLTRVERSRWRGSRAYDVLCICFQTHYGQAWNALLILHDIHHPMVNGHVRKCEFLTKGFASDEHGSWQLSPDGDSLVVKFNCKFDSSGAQSEKTLPLHPSKLDRMGNGAFEGYDDKHCEITMEHSKSLIKVQGKRFWAPTAPL